MKKFAFRGGGNVIMDKRERTGTIADTLQRAVGLHKNGQFAAARRLYESVLSIQPRHFDALHMLGVLLLQTGSYESAHQKLVSAIRINPASPSAYVNLGLVLRAVHRHEDALKCFDSALKLQPGLLVALINRGGCLVELYRFRDALRDLERASQLSPTRPEVLLNMGVAYRELNQFDRSLEILQQLVEKRDDYAAAWRQLAKTYFFMGLLEKANHAIDNASRLAPEDDQVEIDRAAILIGLGKFEEAIDCCKKVIDRNSKLAPAHLQHANGLLGLGRYQEAWDAINIAFQLNNRDPVVLFHRARIAWDTGHKAEALDSLDDALKIHCDMVSAYILRAEVLRNGRQYAEAEKDLLRAADIVGEKMTAEIQPRLLDVRAQMCQWRDRAALEAITLAKIHDGTASLHPFSALSLWDDPSVQRSLTERYVESKLKGIAQIRHIPSRSTTPNEKIKVGYISPDFRHHPIMTILADVFERHDRNQFEWHAFSLTRDIGDLVHERARAAFDHFIDAKDVSDREIVETARRLGIDVMVDLAGHTEGNRLLALAMRCAPVQVTYIGYPGTTAIPNMDYILGSPIVTPPGSESWFTEQLVRLPWLVPVSRRTISDRVWTRADAGLPQDAVVFCSFNNSYKLTPEMLDAWARILLQVEGSVLWLYGKVPEVEANLRREAQARGVDPARLYFAGAVDMPNYLARMRLADLFLDTHPYNAHTTALDAVWAGLPVLTFTGGSFVSRMAAGVLSSIGLTELVASDVADYEARAVALGRNPGRLAELRARLSSPEMRASPPFDTARFARYLEAAYRAMHERAAAGLTPAPMEVTADAKVNVLQ